MDNIKRSIETNNVIRRKLVIVMIIGLIGIIYWNVTIEIKVSHLIEQANVNRLGIDQNSQIILNRLMVQNQQLERQVMMLKTESANLSAKVNHHLSDHNCEALHAILPKLHIK